MSQDDQEDEYVEVFRGPDNRPVAVPEEVVIASERPYRAWNLHQMGATWEQVALQEHYPSARAAAADVGRYIETGAALVSTHSRRLLLETELLRLKYLESRLAGQIEAGSIPAINTALGVSSMRIKLLQLDQNISDPSKELEGRAVVVGSGEDAFTADLKRAAGG